MNNENYNNAENAVNKTKWTVDEYSDRAKDYIREQRSKNEEPTSEGWMDRAKENVSNAWEETKDAVSDAWEKTKDWSEDAKAEVRKATN